MQIKKSILISIILSLTITSAVLFLYFKNNFRNNYVGQSKVENLYVNTSLEQSLSKKPLYSEGQSPTDQPKPTTSYIVGEPISNEEWMNAAGFPKDLNAENIMALINNSRKENGLDVLLTNDSEVCVFAQSALDLLTQLHRLPTEEEAKSLKGPNREIRIAQSLGYDNEETVVTGFKDNNATKYLFEVAELKYGCTKTKSYYVVTAAAF